MYMFVYTQCIHARTIRIEVYDKANRDLSCIDVELGPLNKETRVPKEESYRSFRLIEHILR